MRRKRSRWSRDTLWGLLIASVIVLAGTLAAFAIEGQGVANGTVRFILVALSAAAVIELALQAWWERQQ